MIQVITDTDVFFCLLKRPSAEIFVLEFLVLIRSRSLFLNFLLHTDWHLVRRYLLAHKDAEPHEVPDLPKAAYPLLRSHFKSTTSKLKVEHFSSDGTTVKLLIEMQVGDQLLINVFIVHWV